MYTRRFARNINNNEPATHTLKVSRWSMRSGEGSIIESLSRYGSVLSCLFYPQLNTVYITLRTPSSTRCITECIHSINRRAVVEYTDNDRIHQAEKKAESDRSTVCVMSECYVSDLDIHRYMASFGSIRCLSFEYSYRSNSFICKTSYYEDQSVDQLLYYKPFVNKKVNNCIKVRIERFKKIVRPNAVQKMQKPTYRFNRLDTHDVVSQELCPIVFEGFYSPQKGKVQPVVIKEESSEASPEYLNNLTQDGSKIDETSTGSFKQLVKRSSSLGNKINTYTCVFKDMEIQLENICNIVNSKINETKDLAIKNGDRSTRSSSLDLEKKAKKDTVLVNILKIGSCEKKGNLRKSLFTFKLPQKCFFEIKNNKKYPSTEVLMTKFSNKKDDNEWEKVSFMTQDDLSDGYSAFEERNDPSSNKHRSANKEASVIQKSIDLPETKHSSHTDISCDKKNRLSPNYSNQELPYYSGSHTHQHRYKNDNGNDTGNPLRSVNYFYYPEHIFSTSQ